MSVEEVAPSPWWLPGGHLQTIWSAKLACRAKGAAKWRRERWHTPDEDFIDVDWLNHADQTARPERPLLVLFHGLEGSSQSHYADAFAQMAAQRGWSMALPHFRGCSGELNRQPRAYHSGDWQEIDWILQTVRARQTGPVFAVGVSLGGNALMRWAGELGEAAIGRAQAIASVCSPLDLVASGMALGQGVNRWIYTPIFLQTMRPKARAKWAQHPKLFDLQRALQARTLYEFDDAFTAPVHGFDGVLDYWQRASAKPHLHKVALPALALNARNDPFVPADSLPTRTEVSASVTLWQPSEGGHVGFTTGGFPGHLQAMPESVADWFVQQLGPNHG